MHKRMFVTATAILLVLIVGVSGCILVGCSESVSEEETTAITQLVEAFGKTLKAVDLAGPEAYVSAQIEHTYAPFLTSTFLSELQRSPESAPGRSVSSPWPERIEIASIKRLDRHTYQVQGNFILMTSVEVVNGGNAGTQPVILTVRDSGEGGAWLIDDLSFGTYALYDRGRLTSMLRQAFPALSGIGNARPPRILEDIDLNGDGTHEAIVDLRAGGAYTTYETVCELQGADLQAAIFKDKNGTVGPLLLECGSSVQHKAWVAVTTTGQTLPWVCQMGTDGSPTDSATVARVSVAAYHWNAASGAYEYSAEKSLALQQEQERSLLPRIAAFSSLVTAQIPSALPAVSAAAAHDGCVAWATGTGTLEPNSEKSVNTRTLVLYDLKTHTAVWQSTLPQSWARVLDVQMNDRWVLFRVMQDPGLLPSACYALNRKTGTLTPVLVAPGYLRGVPVPTGATLIQVFHDMALQGDNAYFLVGADLMQNNGGSTTFSNVPDAARLLQVQLGQGVEQQLSTGGVPASRILRLWPLESGVAFSASEVLASGEIRETVSVLAPPANAQTFLFSQWHDASDPRNLGPHVVSPDGQVVYRQNARLVMAPIDRPWAAIPLGPTISGDVDLLSTRVSARYIVLPADNGDILVVNRRTGVTTTLTGAGLRTGTWIASLNDSVLCLVHHSAAAHDTLLYVDLAEHGIGS